MFGLSAGHILILAVVVLMFGSRRLPELGVSMGKCVRGFKRAIDGKELIDEQPPSSTAQLNTIKLKKGSDSARTF